MTIGTSIVLIAAGAILRYAVTATVSGVSLTTVGLILMIVGILGLLLSIMYTLAWAPRRGQVVREYPFRGLPAGRVAWRGLVRGRMGGLTVVVDPSARQWLLG
jgi:Domain of unknown function (DUF6458)